MNQKENDDQAPLLALFETAHKTMVEFYGFLLDQERTFLETCEPEFVTFIRGVPGSHPEADPDTSLITTEAKRLLTSRPQEWVKLLQETSDILVGLRQLQMVLQLTNTVQEETKGAAGVVEVGQRGQRIEFLLYIEQDVIYRILSRLKNGLDRLVRMARCHSPGAFQSAQSLRTSKEDWSKEYKKVRDSMTHTVNFGQDSLLQERAWEAIAVTPNNISPSDIATVRFGGKAEEYFALIREEAAKTAKELLDLYPKWKALLDDLAQPSGSLT